MNILKLFKINNKFQNLLYFKKFVGESPTADCVEYLQRYQTSSDSQNARH
jgi:hypothetical protein